MYSSAVYWTCIVHSIAFQALYKNQKVTKTMLIFSEFREKNSADSSRGSTLPAMEEMQTWVGWPQRLHEENLECNERWRKIWERGLWTPSSMWKSGKVMSRDQIGVKSNWLSVLAQETLLRRHGYRTALWHSGLSHHLQHGNLKSEHWFNFCLSLLLQFSANGPMKALENDLSIWVLGTQVGDQDWALGSLL